MRDKIYKNSFCKDILEVIKKHSYLGKFRQNKIFLKIKAKNYDIILNIKHKLSKRKKYNNYYKNQHFNNISNDSFSKEKIKKNYSSNESMKDKNIKYNDYIQIIKNENSFDNKINKENNKKGKENKEIINKKPKGLINLGLNCYMNALLQCLFYIKELREYFIKNINKFIEKQILCKAFSNVMYGLKNDNKDYFIPNEFKQLIGNKNNLFSEWKAADVKDLFFNLIDNFLTELSLECGNEDSDSSMPNYSDKLEMFLDAKKEIDKNNNIFNELFIGFYFTKYDCNISNKSTYSFQTESFILFDLEKCKNKYEENDLWLEILFIDYIRKRTNVSFFCNYCKKTHTGNSYEKIYRPPKILVIVLDRGHGKIFKGKVEIKKNIDLKPFIDEENYKYSSEYELICVSSHRGASSSSGHYTACCKTDNNKYYYFSDIYVKEIDEKNFIQDEPYLLFYKQKKIKEEEKKIIYEEIKGNQINNIKLQNENHNITSKKNNENINMNERINNIKNDNQKVLEDNSDIQIIESNINNNINNESNNNLNYNKKQFNYDSVKNNNNKITMIKHYSHKIKSEDIKYALNKFQYFLHNKYKVDYYDPINNSLYIWKLKIFGPKKTAYEGRTFNFKLDFNRDFNYLTDNIIFEDKNYDLTFIEENGILLFDYEYNDKMNFYENLFRLFESRYSIFKTNNYKISQKYIETNN